MKRGVSEATPYGKYCDRFTGFGKGAQKILFSSLFSTSFVGSIIEGIIDLSAVSTGTPIHCVIAVGMGVHERI